MPWWDGQESWPLRQRAHPSPNSGDVKLPRPDTDMKANGRCRRVGCPRGSHQADGWRAGERPHDGCRDHTLSGMDPEAPISDPVHEGERLGLVGFAAVEDLGSLQFGTALQSARPNVHTSLVDHE